MYHCNSKYDPLLLVTSVRPRKQRCCAEAMLLNSILAEQWPDDAEASWQSWLLSINKRNICCRRWILEEIALVQDQTGRQFSTYDEEEYDELEDIDAVYSSLGNQVDLNLDVSVLSERCPFFLSSDELSSPGEVEAIIQISVNSLDEFPDCMASYSSFKKIESQGGLGSNVTSVELASTKLFRLAQALSLNDKIWLPFQVGEWKSGIRGALHVLREEEAKGVYRVKLFQDDSTGIIEEGTVLRRELTWLDEHDQRKHVNTEIARVLKVVG